MRIKRRNNLVFLPFVLFCALFVFEPACGSEGIGDQGKGENRKASAPVDKPSPFAEISEQRKVSGFLYDPTGKVDPFKPFIAEQEAVESKEHKKPKTYLETLDLAQLELIAVVLNQREKYAMVQDGKGLGHVIKTGTAIGTNGGTVTEINEEGIVVQEKFTDFRGQLQVKDIKKKMPALE